MRLKQRDQLEYIFLVRILSMKNKIALEMILKAIRYLVVNPSYFKINIAIFISSSKKNRGFSKIEKINKDIDFLRTNIFIIKLVILIF